MKLFTDQEINEMVFMYNTGKSAADISLRFQVSEGYVKKKLINMGVRIRSRQEARTTGNSDAKRNDKLMIKFTDDQVRNIVSLYEKGYGKPYISTKYGVSISVIERVLVDNNIKLRGVEESKHSLWSELRKDTNRLRYGVDNVVQLYTIHKKQQESALRIKELVVNGKIFKYQGYENRAIQHLITQGVSVDDIEIQSSNIPILYYIWSNELRLYYPDIFLPKQHKLIEVKSDYSFSRDKIRNIAKKEAAIEDGFLFEFWVFSAKQLTPTIL